jgi:hypothetical protein
MHKCQFEIKTTPDPAFFPAPWVERKWSAAQCRQVARSGIGCPSIRGELNPACSVCTHRKLKICWCITAWDHLSELRLLVVFRWMEKGGLVGTALCTTQMEMESSWIRGGKGIQLASCGVCGAGLGGLARTGPWACRAGGRGMLTPSRFHFLSLISYFAVIDLRTKNLVKARQINKFWTSQYDATGGT